MKKETIQIKYQRRKLKKTTQIKEKPWNSNKKENTQLKRKLFFFAFSFFICMFSLSWGGFFFICVVSFLFIWFLLKIPFTRAKQIGTARQI